MRKPYLSVEKKNELSVKTITRNGGVYARSFGFDGEQADIYRIAYVFIPHSSNDFFIIMF